MKLSLCLDSDATRSSLDVSRPGAVDEDATADISTLDVQVIKKR